MALKKDCTEPVDDALFGGLSELDKLREAASDAPVIRFVNALLSRAVGRARIRYSHGAIDRRPHGSFPG